MYEFWKGHFVIDYCCIACVIVLYAKRVAHKLCLSLIAVKVFESH